MYGLSTPQLSQDVSSLDGNVGGPIISVDDGDNAGDDVSCQLLSAYLSKHRTTVSTGDSWGDAASVRLVKTITDKGR